MIEYYWDYRDILRLICIDWQYLNVNMMMLYNIIGRMIL